MLWGLATAGGPVASLARLRLILTLPIPAYKEAAHVWLGSEGADLT